MRRIDNQTKTFVGRHADRKPDEEEWRDEEAPPSGFMRERKDNAKDNAANNMGNTQVSNEKYARSVAIADGPADEVGVGLAAEVGLDHGLYHRESRRVRSVLEGTENGATGSVGEIQFARGLRGKIVADHSIDFGSEWLDRDWAAV